MIVLSGVGADTTNASPVPRVYGDGGFDYVPIPESDKNATTEEKTYADVRIRNGTAAEYLDAVYPGGGDKAVKGEALSSYPLHHDPNFDALTYGERRPAYSKRLRRLEEDDCVAFYTGLRADGEDALHRYLIGYIVVEEVVDFEGFGGEEARRRLLNYPENAHTKRFEATGRVDDNLVVVGGDEGGLFKSALRISERADNGHYYLRDAFQDAFSPEPSGSGDTNAYLGGIKQAHVLRVDTDEFVETVRRRAH